MVNISKIIGTLGKLEGSSAKVTLSGKQVLQMAEKKGASAEVSEALSGIISKYPRLKADIAYKGSEQGFTVGAMTLRDGKEVVGRGAASVSGLGTEEAVMKLRLSAGKNGEIAQIRGWNSYAHSPRIQDYEFSTSLKNGVLETSAKNGEFGASQTRIDIPKVVEAAGLKEEAVAAMKKANDFLSKYWGQVRELPAGKEVDFQLQTLAKKIKLAAEVKPIKFDKIIEKNKEVRKVDSKTLERFSKTISEPSCKMLQPKVDLIGHDLKPGKGDKSIYQRLTALKEAEKLGIKIPKNWRDLDDLEKFIKF